VELPGDRRNAGSTARVCPSRKMEGSWYGLGAVRRDMEYRSARLLSRLNWSRAVYARNPVCGQIGVEVGDGYSETQKKVERRDSHELARPPKSGIICV
jgi:hypothetical protein